MMCMSHSDLVAVGTKGSWAFFVNQPSRVAVQRKVNCSGLLGLSTDPDHAVRVVFIGAIASAPCGL